MDGRRGIGKVSCEAGAGTSMRVKRRYAEDISGSEPAAQPQQSRPSRYRGVFWHKSSSKWEARICENSKQRFLGYFTAEEEAARMHDAAALKLHGPLAQLNLCQSGKGGVSQTDAPDMLGLLLSPVRKGTSQFRGVSWNQASGKWRAQLCHGEAVHHLGYYESEVEAAHEYDRNALKLKGPSAATNFPAEEYAASQLGNRQAQLNAQDSQYLGVSWDERTSRWIAELWDGQRYMMLGAFKGELDAARAYDTACARMYGSSAIINFPMPVTRSRKEGGVGNKDAELELAAMEALASMSSNLEDGSHFDISPPGSTEYQQPASPKRGFQVVRQVTPEATAALQPTPSPYQDSNCDNELASEGQPPAEKAGNNSAGKAGLQSFLGVDDGAVKSSLFKGVSWHKHSQRWYAYIQAGGRMRGLGYFHDQNDAAAAYDAEAIKVHGSKAVLNFPQKGRQMSAPPARGVVHLTRASSANLVQPTASLPRNASGAQTQCIKWNPADERYHVFVWDKILKAVKSIGSFESKAAAVRATHVDECAGSLANLQSGSDIRACTAELSRCNSFAGRSVTVSPFSRPAQQRSDTGDATGVLPSSLEPASSIKSPLKLQPQDDPPLAQDEQGFHACNPESAMPSVPGQGQGENRLRPKRAQKVLGWKKASTHTSESDDSSSGKVGNSWGNGSGLPEELGRAHSEDIASGKTRAATLRQSDLLPGSRSGSPLPQAQSLPPRQGRKKTSSRPPAGQRNASQARLQYRGSSKYKGVSWSERSGKWRAQMWFGNKVHHLGFFDGEEAAAKCYDAAVLELRGPSAPTNFEPEEAGSNSLKPSVLQSLTSASLPKVTSKYRGVRWHYCNSKWEARIFNGSRQVSLGYFDNETDAAVAYDAEARGLRGASAVVNFPQAAAPAVAPPRLIGRRQPPSRTETENDDDYLPAPPSRWGSKKRRF